MSELADGADQIEFGMQADVSRESPRQLDTRLLSNHRTRD